MGAGNRPGSVPTLPFRQATLADRLKQFGHDPILGGTLPPDLPVDPESCLAQIDELVVTSRCPCGDLRCHSVTFQHFREGKSADS